MLKVSKPLKFFKFFFFYNFESVGPLALSQLRLFPPVFRTASWQTTSDLRWMPCCPRTRPIRATGSSWRHSSPRDLHSTRLKSAEACRPHVLCSGTPADPHPCGGAERPDWLTNADSWYGLARTPHPTPPHQLAPQSFRQEREREKRETHRAWLVKTLRCPFRGLMLRVDLWIFLILRTDGLWGSWSHFENLSLVSLDVLVTWKGWFSPDWTLCTSRPSLEFSCYLSFLASLSFFFFLMVSHV